jgi:large subunit ribosomal protein L30
MAKVKVTKVRSTIDRNQRQRRTMQALGLNKVGDTNIIENSPSVAGIIKKVAHLISVENA